MNKRWTQRTCASLLCAVLAGPAAAQSPATAGKATAPNGSASVQAFFNTTSVHRIHLELTDKEWSKLQQVKGGMPFGPMQPPPPAPKAGDEPLEIHKGGSFATEFPWARGSVTVDGKTFHKVGFRYKGGGSYMASMGRLRKNVKVDFDRYKQTATLNGLKTLNLNSGAADPTRSREGLAYSIYRAAGVPSPRTAFAEVTVSVPGKYTLEVAGVYTLVEQVDDSFLSHRFQSAKGLLLKPEVSMMAPMRRAFEYLGETWDAYDASYGARRKPTAQEAGRIIEFARLIHKSDDATFRSKIGSFLDVDTFLRFVACTSFVANMDSILASNHNAFIYLDPRSGRFHFIPWDVDLAFAGFPLMGTSQQLMDLSITRPYPGDFKLIDRLLADKAIRARYVGIVKGLMSTAFRTDKVLAQLKSIEAATRDAAAREKAAATARSEPATSPMAMMFGQTPDLKTFMEKRTASVGLQLAGKSKGFVPVGFTFGGPPPRGGRPGQNAGPPPDFKMGNMMAGPMLQALDADKNRKLSRAEWLAWPNAMFAQAKKDADGKVDEPAIAEALNKLSPRPPGSKPTDPPPAFGPGNFLAGPILKRADTGKAGKVALAQLTDSAGALFDAADKGKTGEVDEKAFAEILNELFPTPQFPPPPAK